MNRPVWQAAQVNPIALMVSPVDLLVWRIKIIGGQQNGRKYLQETLAIAAAGTVRLMTETYRLDEIGKA